MAYSLKALCAYPHQRQCTEWRESAYCDVARHGNENSLVVHPKEPRVAACVHSH